MKRSFLIIVGCCIITGTGIYSCSSSSDSNHSPGTENAGTTPDPGNSGYDDAGSQDSASNTQRISNDTATRLDLVQPK